MKLINRGNKQSPIARRHVKSRWLLIRNVTVTMGVARWLRCTPSVLRE